jgi:hypothetical protein
MVTQHAQHYCKRRPHPCSAGAPLAPLPLPQLEFGLRDTPGLRLLLAGTRVAAGRRTHAVLAFLLVSDQQLALGAGSSAAAGAALAPPSAAAAALGPQAIGGAAAVAALAGTRLHWGSVRAPGARWQAPEPGWNTFPADSVDAGAAAVLARARGVALGRWG